MNEVTVQLEGFPHQAEGVVGAHQLLDAVLLQHHDVGQVGAALPGAVLTVNHVRLPAAVLTRHKQQVEHLQLEQERLLETLNSNKIQQGD